MILKEIVACHVSAKPLHVLDFSLLTETVEASFDMKSNLDYQIKTIR